ncbi:MAG TPA: FAD-dependent oxidoreductase [Candidatus Saccharimonadales bacterium]|nr:FAD-dependent oxidoreductase [Candidatus Saccharimonadales bacterium]
MNYIDRVINRITMYRLMLYALLALALLAVGMAIFGILKFDPFAMIFGALVLLGVSIAVNAAFAYMFGVRRNGDSALISAGILFFLFSPPSSPSGYIILALVAALAAASKYILAWRGRHVFNPAATAAVIAGLTGIASASWWVGSGALSFIVMLLGVLILHKTRRLRMGVFFVVLSYAIFLIVSAFKGYKLEDVVTLLINSSPLLFLGGFMLSEPLTQPPRRYERYVFASIVALLAAGQVSFGTFLITPEMALLIGNVYAFFCGQRGGVSLTLIGRRQLPGSQVEYVFKPNRTLRYQAGQYLELHLSHVRPDARGQRRTFTIASAPGQEEIRLGIRHYVPSSTFKKALQGLPLGTKLPVTGIYGDFILPRDTSKKLLFIAGGIGITPFRAQLEWLLRTGQTRDGILLYSVGSVDDVVYQDILMADAHGVETIIVPGPVDEQTLMNVPDIAERQVFISGPPPMVDAVSALLKRQGVRDIRRDHFNGY